MMFRWPHSMEPISSSAVPTRAIGQAESEVYRSRDSHQGTDDLARVSFVVDGTSLEAIREIADSISFHRATLPLICNVTGKVFAR